MKDHLPLVKVMKYPKLTAERSEKKKSNRAVNSAVEVRRGFEPSPMLSGNVFTIRISELDAA